MTTWQVQMSRIADVWIPMKPRDDDGGTYGMDQGDDHWFTDRDEALKWARHLRNSLTWSMVRVAKRGEDGQVTEAEDVP